ncbi:MAG TPA: preprotein translocase subunit SecE [Solirubrobacteraceae bacterium]
MARNRKRPRGRTRQPGSPEDPGQGLPTRTQSFDNGASDREPENGATELEPVDLGSDSLEPVDLGGDSREGAEAADDDLGAQAHDDRDDGAPPPLEHAMPDAELAEEQLSVGRPGEPEPDEGEDEDEFEHEVEESISKGGGGRRRRGRGYDGESGAGAPGAAVAEKRPNVVARFIGFLQGSWRELQRVQWPDRPQVFQATGVVIGFVIVAAVFLGVADLIAGKIVTFVLK